MKKLLVLAVILSFSFVCLPKANAWFWDKKAEDKEKTDQVQTKQPAAEKTKTKEKKKAGEKSEESQKKSEEAQKKAEEEARKARRALIEQKRKEIDNIVWKIQLAPLSGKGNGFSETVVFKNGQVSFSEFGKKGFTPSNFSVKVQDDKIIVWETMQSSEKSGVVFWRGEITQDVQKMRGVVSYQISDKKKEDYSFISTERKTL